MGRSLLFAVIPEDMRADPAKFRAILEGSWDLEPMDWKNHDQQVSKMFMEPLSRVLSMLWFDYECSLKIEELFRSLMEQNPQAQKMEWHLLVGQHPCCISINRNDVTNKQYAVQLTLAAEYPACYFDPPAEGETGCELYLRHYSQSKWWPRQLVNPKAQGRMEARKFLLQEPPELDSLDDVAATVEWAKAFAAAITKLRSYILLCSSIE